MDEWKTFNETTTLPQKEEFYSNINMENITDADYAHANGVCKAFGTKKLRDYQDLHPKNDTLSLADVFKNIEKVCSKIHHLDPAKLFSAPGLAWQAALK